MGDEKSWLESVLKRKNFEESVVRVEDIQKIGNVVKKGDNYLSQITRIKAKVILGSGKRRTVSFIVKDQHHTEQMKKMSEDMGVFFKEITMYRDVLPKMEDLLEEVGDPQGTLWGHCYDYRLYDRLVFEDLGASGFKMANRKKQLGLDAAILVLNGLGKWHALSRILLGRSELPLDVIGKHMWIKSAELLHIMTAEHIRLFVQQMESWGDEWKEAIERFTKAKNEISKKYMDQLLSEADPAEFTVLNHGDCWTNNLLFKYEDNPEHPTSVKFIDLQISFVGSPAYDLHYFLTSSVRMDVREQNYDKLLDVYCESLKKWLLKLGYEGSIPDREKIEEALTKKAIYQTITGLMLAPLVTGNTEDGPDMEEVMKVEMEALKKGEASKGMWKLEDMLNDVGLQILQYTAKKAMEWNVV